MPIFEYECENCHHSFEKILLSQSGTHDVNCPECGSSHLKKKVSVFGVGGGESGGIETGGNGGGCCGSTCGCGF